MVTDHLKNIAKAIGILLIIWLAAFCCKAQNVVRKGNTFVEQIDSTKIVQKAQETDMLYIDKDKNVYNIYLTSTGKAFIVKISKKTGKKYRKYLPKVTEELANK